MTLSTRIAAAVERLGATAALPARVEADEAGHRLALEVTAVGSVGLAFDSLEFAAADTTPRSPENLRAWADRLARRVNYLMEPLVVLEQDREAGALEMRSHAPTSRQGRRSYYEARLHANGSLRLQRIAFDESIRVRAQTSCQMTREVLERLADDLVATAG